MRFLYLYFIAVAIVGCAVTTPATYLNEGNQDRINYGYSQKSSQEVLECLKVGWQTRDIKNPFGVVTQYPPLVETKFPNSTRLAWQDLVLFDVSTVNGKTTIKAVLQWGLGAPVANVTKDVMMKCSEIQKFSSLEEYDPNWLSNKP